MSNRCDLIFTPTCLQTRDRDTCAAKPFSPLWIALQKNSVDLVREALAEDSERAQLPLMDNGWEPPLCAAIRFGCSHEIARLLFEHKSDANQLDVRGRSALCVLLDKAQGAKQAPAYKQSQLAKAHPSRCPPTSIGPFNAGPSHSAIWGPNWDAVPNLQDTLRGFARGNVKPMWIETSATGLPGFSFDQIHASRQDGLLKVAALLLKNGCKYRVGDTPAPSKTKHEDDVRGSKCMRLVHDWPDIATFGVLLYMLKMHQHSHTCEDHLPTLCKLPHENWEHVMGYIACRDTWSATGLRFIDIRFMGTNESQSPTM